MGVPSYFKFIFDKFRNNIVYDSDKYKKAQNISNLFFDFNSLIHPVVKETYCSSYLMMFEKIVVYTDKIIELVNPSNMVYIAIDGIPPMSKIIQQRMRRYKAVKDVERIEKLKEKYGMDVVKDDWDYNMISPSTKFMKQLLKYLRGHFNNSNHPFNKDKTHKVIISGSNKRGEGEHKIMDYLAKMTTKQDIVQKYLNCIYGMDGDLLFLTLLQNNLDVCLIREKVHVGNRGKAHLGEFVYVDIDGLRQNLLEILDPYLNTETLLKYNIFRHTNNYDVFFDEIDKNVKSMTMVYQKTNCEMNTRLIMDYVCLCFLVGNDFLPSLPSIKIINGGLEELIIIYKYIQTDIQDFLLNNDKTINYVFFIRIIGELAFKEDEKLAKETDSIPMCIERFYNSITYSKAKNPYDKELLDSEFMLNKVDDDVKMGKENWRSRYYKHHFQIDVNLNNDIEKDVIDDICKQYLLTLEWNLLYYFRKQYTWLFHYKYNFAPSVLDLYKFLETPNAVKNIDRNIIFAKDDERKITGKEQLMMILPPKSIYRLISEKYHVYVKDERSCIYHWFPNEFEIDTLGKSYLWMCHPILPYIDYKLLPML